MEIITSHTNADFDSLAAMVAAKKIYPDGVLAFPGSADAGVRSFLAVNPWLSVKHAGDIHLNDVTKLILVDTREAHRLGDFRELIEKPGIEIHVYDHHPTSYRDIVGEKNVVKPMGSTTTIFVEMIRDQNLSITPDEATLFYIGIHVDTGSLSFAATTPADIQASNYLVERGADLNRAGEWLHRKMTDEQRQLLDLLTASSQVTTVQDHSILIATASLDAYVEDLASLMYKLGDFEKISAAFAVAGMGERIYVVGRSVNPNVNVGEILIEMGGGGHSTAASVAIKGTDIEKIKADLIAILKKKVRPGKTEIIPDQSPLIKIDDWSTAPVPIVDRLKQIGEFGSQKGLNVFVVGGFVRDLLRSEPANCKLACRFAGERVERAEGALLLKIKDLDLDIVVEGDGIAFAKFLADKLGGSFFSFEKFGTASVILPNKQKIDVATARKEFYARPAALPDVVGTTIKQDLIRRDFSINGMAIKLNPPSFGRLIDFFNGQRDLQHGVIRVLHNLSFTDDPTRIFRAVRFEQRYGFKMESHTEKLLKDALKERVIRHLSMERISNEIVLILSETNPIPALKRMRELHIFSLIDPEIKLSNKIIEIMEAISQANWIVFAIALFSELEPQKVNEVLNRLRWSGKDKDKFSVLFSDWKKRLQEIGKGREIQPSQLAKLLDPVSDEGLIFLAAATKSPEIHKRIESYSNTLRKVKALLSGEDLVGMGIKPGPQIGSLLEQLRDAQLDGEIKTKEDAMTFIRKKSA